MERERDREESLRLQPAGASAAASREEAERGLGEARRDFHEGRGHGYGIGVGLIKTYRENERTRYRFAVTDGQRQAAIDALVSETTAATLANEEEDVTAWTRDRLYRRIGSISRDDDRYARLLEQDPLHLSY